MAAWLAAAAVNSALHTLTTQSNLWASTFAGATALSIIYSAFGTAAAWAFVAAGAADRPRLMPALVLKYLLPVFGCSAAAAPALHHLYGSGDSHTNEAGGELLLALFSALAPVALFLAGVPIGNERWRKPVLWSLLALAAGRAAIVASGLHLPVNESRTHA